MPYEQRSNMIISTECMEPRRGVRVNAESVISLVEFIPELDYDEEVFAANVVNVKKRLHIEGFCYASIVAYSDFSVVFWKRDLCTE